MVRRFIQILPIIFALVLFALSIKIITTELKAYSLQSIVQYLATIPRTHKLGTLLLTGLGYLTMTGYDLLGFRYIGERLAPVKIMLTAFISYAVGNTIGFTAFSGTAIRYRFYGTWGISKLKIAQLTIFTHLTFWVGLFGVSGVVFLIDPLSLPKILDLPFQSAHPIGIIFLIFVSIYFTVSVFWKHSLKIGSESIKFPSPKISLASISLAALDWGLASGVLYLLLPINKGLSFPGFFGIYILALTAGLISTVPGGLGVFETVVLLLIPSAISSSEALSALIAYRVVYYFLPLSVALLLLIIQEVRHHRFS